MFRCFRYLKVLSRSIYIYISVFRQLDIQVGDLFPWISMPHRRQPRSAGPTSGATGADRAVENGAHERRPPARAFRRHQRLRWRAGEIEGGRRWSGPSCPLARSKTVRLGRPWSGRSDGEVLEENPGQPGAPRGPAVLCLQHPLPHSSQVRG